MSSFALLPYQQQWVSDRARYKMFVKSRRIGISWATAAEAVLEASAADGQDVWYVAQTEDDAQQFMRDAKQFAAACQLMCAPTGVELYDSGNKAWSTVSALRFASGFGIHGLSRRPARLHGKEGYAILDEGALSEDFGGFLEAVSAYEVWGRGRVAIISSESGGAEHPFHRSRVACELGDLPWSLHVVDIFDAVRDGLYRRICEKNRQAWSPEAEQAWLAELKTNAGPNWESQFLCRPAGAGDVFFDRVQVRAAMRDTLPVARFAGRPEMTTDDKRVAEVRGWFARDVAPHLRALDKTRPHYVGADYGRSGDITAIHIGEGEATGRLSVRLAIELRNTPDDCQRDVWSMMVPQLPRLGKMAIDAGGQGSSIAEHLRQQYGGQVLPIGIGAGRARKPADRPERSLYYSEIFPAVRQRIQDGTLVLPLDTDTLDDIMGVRMVDGMPRVPSTRTKDRRGGQRHCDAAVALGLLVFAAGEGGTDWTGHTWDQYSTGAEWAM